MLWCEYQLCRYCPLGIVRSVFGSMIVVAMMPKHISKRDEPDEPDDEKFPQDCF